MRKKRFLTQASLAAGATLTLGLMTIAPANADAEEKRTLDDIDNNAVNALLADHEDFFDNSVFNEEDDEIDFEAHIVISTQDEIKTFSTKDDSKTVIEVLEDNNLSVSDYRDDSGNRVDSDDLDREFNSGETVLLHSHKRTVDTEEITLEHRVEEIETDELYEGETEVEQEGIDGSALKITLTSGYNGSEESTEERLTVLEAPQREIVLVGTAERPEPEIEVASDEEFGDTTIMNNSDVETVDVNDIETNDDIVNNMISQVGNQYTWGGTTVSGGFDCSGIIYWAYQQEGKSIPRVAIDQGNAGIPVSWDEAQTGDFVYTETHIAVLIREDGQEDRLVHAANPNRGVIIDSASHYKNQGYKVSRLPQ